MLVLENIGKTVRGDMHLRDIDLTMEAGSLHVVLGRTRAGKTSLLRIIAGLDRPTTGRILWQGEDITRASLRTRSVALVYQQFINYPSLTVHENIASPLRVQQRQRRGQKQNQAQDQTQDGKKHGKKAARERVDARVRELAATLRIEHLLDRLPGQLSGGQQQRVAIARALAKGADLLLLDEPLVNLDYKLREELREELQHVLAKSGATALYATSDPAEALALGGHTVVLHQGRVLQHAPALEAYHRPASTDAARLLSDPPMSIFDVTVSGGAATLSGDVRIPLPPHLTDLASLAGAGGGACCLGIRASDCALRDPGGGVPVRARVELSEVGGSETFLYLRHGDVPFIVQEDGVFLRDPGEELVFYLDPNRLLAFDAGGALLASYR